MINSIINTRTNSDVSLLDAIKNVTVHIPKNAHVLEWIRGVDPGHDVELDLGAINIFHSDERARIAENTLVRTKLSKNGITRTINVLTEGNGEGEIDTTLVLAGEVCNDTVDNETVGDEMGLTVELNKLGEDNASLLDDTLDTADTDPLTDFDKLENNDQNTRHEVLHNTTESKTDGHTHSTDKCCEGHNLNTNRSDDNGKQDNFEKHTDNIKQPPLKGLLPFCTLDNPPNNKKQNSHNDHTNNKNNNTIRKLQCNIKKFICKILQKSFPIKLIYSTT